MTTALNARDVSDRLLNAFRMADPTCEFERTTVLEGTEGTQAGVRHWLHWENPADAHDIEDYDWQVPNEFTASALRLLRTVSERDYPAFDIQLTVEEKNWISIQVLPRPANFIHKDADMTKTAPTARTRTKPTPAAAPETTAPAATETKPSKFVAAAGRVVAWATENRESKTYAWDTLLETKTVDDIAKELEAAGITQGDKAISHYRKEVKVQAEQRAQHQAEADAGK